MSSPESNNMVLQLPSWRNQETFRRETPWGISVASDRRRCSMKAFDYWTERIWTRARYMVFWMIHEMFIMTDWSILILVKLMKMDMKG
mmetsp:Transcript_39659/g.82423  ORF Transcript_39659/g.82423 Transcript_39659/m.82423 type:complete len:88 (+) Transcript_39659:795-1058(+)